MTFKKLAFAPAFALAALMGAQVAFAAPVFSVGINPVVVTQNGPAATPAVTFATIRLNAVGSTEDILVSSIPVSISAANGGNTSNLSSCRVVNLSNGTMLNSGANIPAQVFNGTTSFNLDTAFRVPAGSMIDVAVRCDILASNAINNTYAFNIDPTAVVATSATTGLRVTPTVGTGVSTVPIVTTTSNPGSVIIPGLPNTGLGGEAATNIALLALAGIVTAAGFAYTRRATR